MKVKDKNKERYNQIWKRSDVQNPAIWSTWPVIKEIIGKKNLEVGPGNYPVIPVENGYFLDISETAVANLQKAGAKACLGSVEKIDSDNSFFDLVVAIDVLEHVDDDHKAFSEISRVLKPKGFFLFSVPLDKKQFSQIDEFAGHQRRYEINELVSLVLKKGFKVVKWRAPSLKYFWLKPLWKLPFLGQILIKAYGNKKSFKFFGLPKFFVNFLVRFTAFIDRISAPDWQKDKKSLKNFHGESVMLLCRKK